VACFLFTGISFPWYNLAGCVAVVVFAMVLNSLMARMAAED